MDLLQTEELESDVELEQLSESFDRDHSPAATDSDVPPWDALPGYDTTNSLSKQDDNSSNAVAEPDAEEQDFQPDGENSEWDARGHAATVTMRVPDWDTVDVDFKNFRVRPVAEVLRELLGEKAVIAGAYSSAARVMAGDGHGELSDTSTADTDEEVLVIGPPVRMFIQRANAQDVFDALKARRSTVCGRLHLF
jgi:hypothetical protein